MTSASTPLPGPATGPQGLDGFTVADVSRGERALDISEIVAAAVLAVPGVADLHGGTFGQVASYLPGRSVTGVRIRPDVTDIHVVLFWGAPVLATAEKVRATVQPLVETLSARVDITIDDVIDPSAQGATKTHVPGPKPPPGQP